MHQDSSKTNALTELVNGLIIEWLKERLNWISEGKVRRNSNGITCVPSAAAVGRMQ
jgi:hypothetical protein